MSNTPIPVIDLFAGPGGLAEGFSRFRIKSKPVFKIRLSIETDPHAHQTLELRAFYRQFPDRKAPTEYYDYLAGRITRADLFNAHPSEAKEARSEAWNATLGVTDPEEINARIVTALNGRKDWLLIGGPPCQAYSLVGRSKIIGEKGREKYEADHRHFLYREYLRIIADHRPRVFVMENVKGLLSARVNNEGMFSRILADLQHPLDAIYGPRHRRGHLSYRLVSAAVPPSNNFGDVNNGGFIVHAENYGIPQARHRLIIIGIADGVSASPGLLVPKTKVSVAEAIGDLPPLRSGLSKEPDSAGKWCEVVRAIRNANWLHDSKVDESVRREIRQQLQSVTADLERGAEWMRPSRRSIRFEKDWFTDDSLEGVCNHATRSHIREDLYRYFFVSAFACVHGRSPLLDDFPTALLPDHENVAEALKETKFNDRFRVQVAGRPATTVTSHISKDGHYFIHYDPAQCRSLTVREAARLQTFPDNYFFEGPRTQQYHQVGNAVPPLLAHQIAAVVADIFQ
ncbi:MAG TPA: DNA cytosine methyltransferase [Verrucomicrobiota bacterium]|nr:DNA cytosine methyltransferase [Verrucomicrobiota bacterium]